MGIKSIMKAIGKMIKKMEKENIYLKMRNMKEILKMIRNMDLDYIIFV